MTWKTLGIVLWIAASACAEVRVWQGTLHLPVYEEGAPDRNPPFDLFATGRFNYPYTLREELTARRVEQDLRALWIENEYLKCSVLPDIGGHLYSCTDKLSGKEMFYANPSLKKARVGYRGAWAAFGIEFNFPVSHNWMSMSPVDFATASHPDGSASIWVGNTDLPYGMRWLVELILRPGSTVVEQRVRLSNPSAVRHRYYWWNNAAVEVWNDSRIHYPMRWTASHGFTAVDTWPVNRAGLDLSVVGNHTAGPVSQFAHGSREPFMGVYHPRTQTGTVHYAPYEDLPAKKIWSWGVDPDGLDWRKALSDNESAYVEVQAGLFRDQETYAFLQPGEQIEFSEYWMPVRSIGCISRANLHGVVCLERRDGEARIAVNVNHEVDHATFSIQNGERVVHTESLRATPGTMWEAVIAAPQSKLTFELLDAQGRALLTHVEDTYDWSPETEIRLGPQPRRTVLPPEKRSEAGWLEFATDQERNGAKLDAMASYRLALSRYPGSFLLQRAAGRLAVDLKQYDVALNWLRSAQTHVSNDPEIHYYLGLALEARGRIREARTEYEGAYRVPGLREAARVRLGGIAAREQNWDAARRFLAGTVWELPVLRAAGAERSEALRRWAQRDPVHALVRYEQGVDAALLRHLAADPNRVIELASLYMHLGFWKDALEVLDRRYPAVPDAEREPGAVLPQDHALVSYYRGYVRERAGTPGRDDFELASRQSLEYVFPHRADSLPVLEAALKANPDNANARFLLGSLHLSGGKVEEALAEWEAARKRNGRIPVLHRNIARTLLVAKHDAEGAAAVYREGLAVDPRNTEIYTGLCQSLSILGRPAAERVAVLRRYPDRESMPAPLVFDLALSLAEAGDFAGAEALFRGRFFAREEGGTNVRQVWIEVQLQKALSSGDAGVVARLGQPVEGLDWTRDGMDAFLRGARFHYLAGLAAERAGDMQEAERHWRRAASEADSLQVAYARRAAQRLPGYDDALWVRRVEARLAATADNALAWRGAMLASLGRRTDALAAFRDAQLAPDRALSRYLARTEARGLQPR